MSRSQHDISSVRHLLPGRRVTARMKRLVSLLVTQRPVAVLRVARTALLLTLISVHADWPDNSTETTPSDVKYAQDSAGDIYSPMVVNKLKSTIYARLVKPAYRLDTNDVDNKTDLVEYREHDYSNALDCRPITANGARTVEIDNLKCYCPPSTNSTLADSVHGHPVWTCPYCHPETSPVYRNMCKPSD
ncbi:hypothetical protein LSAT2_031724 [Lamellibrachia satsuma]|nr:hypothetical protein LSAT2_031724 [Lamellibrachia satsuma]